MHRACLVSAMRRNHRTPTLEAILADTAPRYRMTPVEKAVAKQKWSKATLGAHLQALAGEDWQAVIEHVAMLTYLVGCAADYDMSKGQPFDMTDLRIIHGAARTALDVSRFESLTHLQRGSLEAGLLAIERIYPHISDHAMRYASTRAQVLMAVDGIYWKDFEEFV